MIHHALLLDSGMLIVVPADEAMQRAHNWNARRAHMIATGDLISLRRCVALVRIKRKPHQSAGGKARAASMTPAARSAVARKAANIRWGKE